MRRLFLILAVLSAAPCYGEPFRDTLQSLGQPTLGADATHLDDVELQWGHAAVRLTGEIESVVAAGGAVGFAFEGTGRLEMTIPDGPFRQAVLTSLDDQAGWKPSPGEPAYGVGFRSAVFFTDRQPEGLDREGHVTSAALAKVMTRTLERWSESPYVQPDHALAAGHFDPQPGDRIIAFLWDGHDDLLYRCDGLTDHEERLGRWKKITGGGLSLWITETLIQQPVAFDPRVRPIHDVTQTAIDLELVSPDNEMVDEHVVTEITAHRDGVRLVRFDLLNGRSERYARWDERQAPFDIVSITDEGGQPLEFSHRYDELLVLLREPLRRGQNVTLTIDSKGALLKNFKGDNYTVLGNMAYLPQLDINATMAPFHVVAKVKEPFIALSCGKTVRRWKDGDMNCLEAREERPLAFPFVVVGDFEVHETDKGGYHLNIYSYAMGKERGAKNLARNGLAILDFYSNGMLDFPYGELDVVEIPYFRHFFWQAPAGLVEITSEGLAPISGDTSDLDTLIRRYASKGQNSRYAHEIAHQWFGNVVSWATPYDNWLSESFAEYLSYMFMSEGAKDRRKAKVQFRQWEIDVKECSDVSSIYGASSLNGSRTTESCYTQLLYGKGPYVLHALRAEMGDQNFKKMLYFLTTKADEKKLKVTTEDVIQFVNALSGRDLRPWFDRYIYGTEVPSIDGT